MADLNYATRYGQDLLQQLPFALYFGAMYNFNDNRYRWLNEQTIMIPTISTSGRVDANRETDIVEGRHYNNNWTPMQVKNFRAWQTNAHPLDIVETNMVATIQNITRVFNQEQKIPEMNAYFISKVYSDWTSMGHTADTTALTEANILSVFDTMMAQMDEKRVPREGRLLYTTPDTYKMLKNAEKVQRVVQATGSPAAVQRGLASLDSVRIEPAVPSDMMQTEYDFTEGYKTVESAKQINMMLAHPMAVITPTRYTVSMLDAPSAKTQGKWKYYEESYDDVFVLPMRDEAIAMNITTGGA